MLRAALAAAHGVCGAGLAVRLQQRGVEGEVVHDIKGARADLWGGGGACGHGQLMRACLEAVRDRDPLWAAAVRAG